MGLEVTICMLNVLNLTVVESWGDVEEQFGVLALCSASRLLPGKLFLWAVSGGCAFIALYSFMCFIGLTNSGLSIKCM